jgi:hypothetical protein
VLSLMATEKGRKSIQVESNQLENLSWMANQISSAQESKKKRETNISLPLLRSVRAEGVEG